MLADKQGQKTLKILHIITGLNAGGAEAMLAKLVGHFAVIGGPASEVVCLTPEGVLAAPIRALGVKVTCLGIKGPLGALAALGRLRAIVARSGADVIHCWMYHANILGGLAAMLAGQKNIIWGIRQSGLDPTLQKRSTVALARLGARLSRRIPAVIACVSDSARADHAAIGYDASRMVVIPNGFDLNLFRADAVARQAVRAEAGIPADAVVLGLAARFDPQKDVAGFLAAAARAARSAPEIHVLLAGEGMDAANPDLARALAKTGMTARAHLLGRRTDMHRVTAAFDVAVSASVYGEGFSNTLGEALACAVPVVATDVGDARMIVGDAGYIVPPRDVSALAEALGALVAIGTEGRARLGALGREHMQRDFAIGQIAARYRALYDEMLVARRVRGRWRE